MMFDEPMDYLVFVTKRGIRKQLPNTGTPKTKTHKNSEDLKKTNAENEDYAFTLSWKNILEMFTKT